MAQPSQPLPYRRHALVLALALAAGSAQADTLAVTAQCTLINAINNANTDTDTDGTGGCPAGNGADTLNLKANAIYTVNSVNNQDPTGPNGLPLITSTITLNGNGATLRRNNAAGTTDFRLIRINGGNLTINKLTIRGGHLSAPYQYGGGVNNGGTLTLNDSTLTNNSSVGTGAIGSAIATMYQSSLTLNNSTVTGNQASHGAGIMTFPGAATTINNSTIDHNEASSGGIGGIGNGGVMVLTNSTVSHNRSLGAWGVGGISNGGDAVLALNHSTIAHNSTGYGNVAGIQNTGTLTLTNTLIANSQNGGDCYTNTRYGGTTVFQGQNLIADGTCNATLSGPAKLAPLLDNGGPTLTHAIHTGSPAINIANALCVAIDQRYVSRPQPTGGVCDIGAFEQIKTPAAAIAPLVHFFDAQTANHSIIGIGQLAAPKTQALRNQLLTAGDNKAALLDTQACQQLTKALSRLDTDNSPDANDYVTGSQVAALKGQIDSLRTDWACP
jgi:hypothetical protein